MTRGCRSNIYRGGFGLATHSWHEAEEARAELLALSSGGLMSPHGVRVQLCQLFQHYWQCQGPGVLHDRVLQAMPRRTSAS